MSSYTDMQHCRQLENWDCGIACLQIIQRWLRDDDETGVTTSELSFKERSERNWMLRFVGTESIWTADLVILLERLLQDYNGKENTSQGIRASYIFCSQVRGVDDSHSSQDYYVSEFSNDCQRVNQIFERMQRQNLPILCPIHLDFWEVLYVVCHENCVAIALVDNNVLEPNDCGLYIGHYVILAGVSRNRNNVIEACSLEKGYNDEGGNEYKEDYCLVVVNPGIAQERSYVTPSRFEKAWRANGTDCDVIFISKHSPT